MHFITRMHLRTVTPTNNHNLKLVGKLVSGVNIAHNQMLLIFHTFAIY